MTDEQKKNNDEEMKNNTSSPYTFVSSKKQGVELSPIFLIPLIGIVGILVLLGSCIYVKSSHVRRADGTSFPVTQHNPKAIGTDNSLQNEYYDIVSYGTNYNHANFTFRNIPIARALSYINDHAGVSINLRGSITGIRIDVNYQNKTVEEFLNLVADKYGWKVRKIDGKNFEIMDRQTYQELVPPGTAIVKIFKLVNITYEKAEPIVNKFLTPNVGTIAYDQRTNKLIISDTPETIDKIEKIIKEIDIYVSTPVAEDTTQKIK